MIERIFTIYAIRNKVNGKIYVGRTSQTVRERAILHFRALKNGKHNSPTMQDDYNKYGKDVFEVYEIEKGVPWDSDREYFYMDLYRSCNKDYGYNAKDPHHKTALDFEIFEGRPAIPK